MIYMPKTGVVSTVPERCKRCYSCIRECPARAIQIIGGQAVLIEARCIGCGNCVKVCTQNAKSVRSGAEYVISMLESNEKVEKVAMLAPSFVAAAPWSEPLKVIGALKKMGFTKVVEVAFGADLVSAAYKEFLAKRHLPSITSPCPAIVEYIQKYYPEIIEYLVPIVSPMIATARVVRARYGSRSQVVFIGPCVAKKLEITDMQFMGDIDEALTYDELARIFDSIAIDVSSCENAEFDEPRGNLGAVYPIPGGLLKSAGIASDIMEQEVVVVEGPHNSLKIIHEIAHGNVDAQLIDILFCEGCLNGPGLKSHLNFYEKRERMIKYAKEQVAKLNKRLWSNSMLNYQHLVLDRKFQSKEAKVRVPSEDEITKILESMGKTKAEDQLNCGACGYETCREHAISVAQGLAEPEMCLVYTIEKLEKQHNELADAQEQLIQREKLASVGQLAAGVAHEINNPLGSIVLYSHLLLKQIADTPAAADIKFIIEEAERCKKIVSSLLNFARQGKLQIAEISAETLVKNVMNIVEVRPEFDQIIKKVDIASNIPNLFVDADQLKQVLLNLTMNACEAMDNSGTLNVSAELSGTDKIKFLIKDTGHGIPKDNIPRLFTPFFTTKQIGKGTGLGLSIAYGIIKLHNGSISVTSEEGKGTTFTVIIPLDIRNMPSQRMSPPDFSAALSAKLPKQGL